MFGGCTGPLLLWTLHEKQVMQAALQLRYEAIDDMCDKDENDMIKYNDVRKQREFIHNDSSLLVWTRAITKGGNTSVELTPNA